MIDLAQLAGAYPDGRLVGDGTTEIRGLAYDSRAVRAGDLFFCVPGHNVDGLKFLPQAVAAGAVAAVTESDAAGLPVPAIEVASVRQAMPLIAAAFHGHPSRKLRLVGVTGTNGKTTTTYLIEAIARACGDATGVIGTIGARIDDMPIDGDRTTPESPDLQELFARMATGDRRRTVAMEVSSHALALGRTLGAEFDVAVFTNLTQDHLDYHGSMQEYFEAKARLFLDYPHFTRKRFHAVINVDDRFGRELVRLCDVRTTTFGTRRDADLRASRIRGDAGSLRYQLAADGESHAVRLRLGGLFNVSNSLGAMGAARALGWGWEQIIPAIESASGVPGRFESVSAGQEFGVIVDYAHTPDGLENVLRAARALEPKRLITVFGCGGDRDRTKRPIMGRISGELSDVAIVTSDNPRTEEPESILDGILAGMNGSRARIERVCDRREAIRLAIETATPGDLVVIAGKGHEDYQIIGHEKFHFDDREEARAALRKRGFE